MPAPPRNGGAEHQADRNLGEISSVYAAAHCAATHPSPREIFRARCEARALLFADGYLDLHSAVDVLQADAVASGLVRAIGQDAVQAEMARAFADIPRHVEWVPDDADIDVDSDTDTHLADIPCPRDYRLVSRGGVASAAELQRDYEAALARERSLYGPAQSTIDAFWYVVRLNEPDRLKAFLSRRSSEERAQLLSLLEAWQWD
jgi:hypothetical protein